MVESLISTFCNLLLNNKSKQQSSTADDVISIIKKRELNVMSSNGRT